MTDDESNTADPGIPGFWSRVFDAPARLLALDYDGTLAPFQVERMSATPLPGIVDALQGILRRCDTEVALISGRPVEQVLTLLGDLRVTIIGAHGWEVRGPDGGRRDPPLDPTMGDALGKVWEALGDWQARAEQKRASVAFHIRGMPSGAGETALVEVRRRWRALGPELPLELLAFDGGLEMRAPGRHKGDAMQSLLETAPAGTFGVYLGDDLTDEDAFRALEGRGVGIRVGPELRFSAAAGRLDDIPAVRAFLERWGRG
jgi:trehalose 6-phosphate phosphatase